MTDKNKNEVQKTGHIYDEIEELDHAPPRWFTGLFLSTVVIGFIYWFYYTLGNGLTLTAEYEKAEIAEEIEQNIRSGKSSEKKKLSETELVAFVKDDSKVKLGASIYQAKCLSCHGAQGQGGIGPNLIDRYWLHGGKMTEILETISKGVPEKGMPPWGSLLTAEEIQSVVVFIRTLKDTKPADAKAPQGELVSAD